jgi:hypothetical protein
MMQQQMMQQQGHFVPARPGVGVGVVPGMGYPAGAYPQQQWVGAQGMQGMQGMQAMPGMVMHPHAGMVSAQAMQQQMMQQQQQQQAYARAPVAPGGVAPGMGAMPAAPKPK